MATSCLPACRSHGRTRQGCGVQEQLTPSRSKVDEASHYDHLVLIPGHAVWLGGPPEADASWALAPFQSGEGRAFLGHLRTGVEQAADDPRAWLLTSGGCTRSESPEQSEAQSYLDLATQQTWFGHEQVAERASAEPCARDSYENVLLSLLAFRERHGRWPRRVTVSGWGFKAPRFKDHAEALGWPLTRFQYRGSGAPSDPGAAAQAEDATRALFQSSLNAPPLVAKRRARGFSDRHLPTGLARFSPRRLTEPAFGLA